jgi:hypothetical protein
MRAFRILPILLSLLFAIAVGTALSAPNVLQNAHADRKVLPRSCQSCHRGMQMAINGEEKVCFDCHGAAAEREKIAAKGYLVTTNLPEMADIAAELRKPYNHPVLSENGVHHRTEILPEELDKARRHAECADCHDAHVVAKGSPFLGLQGKRVGNAIGEIEKPYELCYKCHSSSANLPGQATDKALEFRITNPSFHPVEGEGRRVMVISLREPYATRDERPGDISIIGCDDCHGSDSPEGPKGPHGSNYRGLLKRNYDMTDGRPESEFAYALCYKCHNRNSILSNESFPYHAQHIDGDLAAGRLGTPCFTCHDAHGSTENPYLIRFNEEVVRDNAEGKLEYKEIGVATRHGKCSLNCHDVEHLEREY